MTNGLDHELDALLEKLLALTHAWSAGAACDGMADDLLRRAVRAAHARYAEVIPVYRRLADSARFDAADVDDIVGDLMLSDEVFKSYQVSWLESGRFDRMTEWLAGRFSHPIDVPSDRVRTIAAWRDGLREQGVFLTSSTGTSGRWSFVPRDALTLKALARNGGAYYHRVWTRPENGQYGPFDCLILAPRGTGFGLQAAGTGLARMAGRSHYLTDSVGTDAAEPSYARGIEFLRESARSGTRAIIFGAPFQIADLAEHVRMSGERVALAADSLVISGGGWKSFEGRRIRRSELTTLIAGALGVSDDRVIDTYSTAELNCVFMTCAEGHYHVPPLVAPVVFDQALTGAWGREGSGILGVLDPFARSYPGFIITGDLVTLARGRCGCGLDGWMITGEIGRAPGQDIRGCGGVMAALLA
jgi:hypothetical protein